MTQSTVFIMSIFGAFIVYLLQHGKFGVYLAAILTRATAQTASGAL